MAGKYQFVGMVDPQARIDQVEYSAGKFMTLKGEPQSLSDAQVQKLGPYVVLRKIDEGEEPAAEFGPEPEEAKPDKPVAALSGAGGRS